MQVVSRTHLQDFLTGDFVDPDQQFGEELATFANAILLAAPPFAKYFLYADSDNGPDPDLSSNEDGHDVLTGDTENGYYGMSSYGQYDDASTNIVYYCFMAGSEGASASGFKIAPVLLAD